MRVALFSLVREVACSNSLSSCWSRSIDVRILHFYTLRCFARGENKVHTRALSGTIGQPDASGPLTNGQYSVRGGFWTLPVAVQVIGSPTLTIAPAGPGQATLSWSPPRRD